MKGEVTIVEVGDNGFGVWAVYIIEKNKCGFCGICVPRENTKDSGRHVGRGGGVY